MRKRIFAIVLASMCLSVVSCGNKESKKGPQSGPNDSSTSPSSSEVEEQYNIVRPEYTPEYNNYSISAAPTGFNMTYYSDIYSRGFSWITDTTVDDTKLYLVESDKGEAADFSNAELIEGEAKKVTLKTSGKVVFEDGSYPEETGSSNSSEQVMYSHKVHVENLKKGKAYSYKAGSGDNYRYGAFVVEKEKAKSITAVQLSDAQTKEPSKLNVWRNTFVKSVETAGNDLDMVLYNGDQFDQNMEKINDVRQIRFNTYSKALDIIQDYKFNLPYMTSSGNHEPAARYSQFLHADINYPEGAVSGQGVYYSYDYDYAHFVVLNTNDVSNTQINWLKDDLEAAKDAKWKIVMMHISPYSTGDHSNKTENQNIVQKLTPIFSEKHVDLVLQAHDHTYNKTLPYRWDAAGYTETWNNDEVVNLEPETQAVGEKVYDKNPQGTYYVTTGAAGHRCGAPEATDGVWAEVVKDGDEFKALDSSYTYLNNKYKIEMGRLKYSNSYEPYSGTDDSRNLFRSEQNFEAGNLATGCVNAQMFGVLNIDETTLSYTVYTVNSETVKMFDSVDVLKA